MSCIYWEFFFLFYCLKQKTLIGPESRDETVRWLIHTSKKLKFHPETVVLSVSILDRFLHAIKVSHGLLLFSQGEQIPVLCIINVSFFFLFPKFNELSST